MARVSVSERVESYLPAWREYAGALFNARADERLEASGRLESGWVAEAKSLIVEEILPNASLARAALTDNMIDGISIVWDVTTGLYYEERRDGMRTLARDEILAPFGRHGDWERLSPRCVRYELRRSKEARALVRAALEQELEMRAAYWLGRAMRSPSGNASRAAAVASVPEFPNRAKWLRDRLAEREFNKHDLRKHGGPEHRTTQKILDGLAVQEDIHRKVIAGLQSKRTHKGLTLPAVKESDIPND
jgi:hypothetical protein